MKHIHGNTMQILVTSTCAFVKNKVFEYILLNATTMRHRSFIPQIKIKLNHFSEKKLPKTYTHLLITVRSRIKKYLIRIIYSLFVFSNCLISECIPNILSGINCCHISRICQYLRKTNTHWFWLLANEHYMFDILPISYA